MLHLTNPKVRGNWKMSNSNVIWGTVWRLVDEIIQSDRVSGDPMVYDLINSTWYSKPDQATIIISYYNNNVYMLYPSVNLKWNGCLPSNKNWSETTTYLNSKSKKGHNSVKQKVPTSTPKTPTPTPTPTQSWSLCVHHVSQATQNAPGKVSHALFYEFWLAHCSCLSAKARKVKGKFYKNNVASKMKNKKTWEK